MTRIATSALYSIRATALALMFSIGAQNVQAQNSKTVGQVLHRMAAETELDQQITQGVRNSFGRRTSRLCAVALSAGIVAIGSLVLPAESAASVAVVWGFTAMGSLLVAETINAIVFRKLPSEISSDEDLARRLALRPTPWITAEGSATLPKFFDFTESFKLLRQNPPGISDAEIQRRLEAWLRTRAGRRFLNLGIEADFLYFARNFRDPQ